LVGLCASEADETILKTKRPKASSEMIFVLSSLPFEKLIDDIDGFNDQSMLDGCDEQVQLIENMINNKQVFIYI
jgi:hypothetical protein